MQESNGKYSISFEELSRRGKEILDKQGPISYEKAKEQVERLKKGSYLHTMNEYLVNAVKRIIVPEGLQEVTIQIGEYIIIVRADGTSNVSLAH